MPLRVHLLSRLSAIMLACGALPYGLHTEGRALDANTLAEQQTFSSAKLSSTSWPDADWWNSLGASNLDAMIRRARQNSPDLQVADARPRTPGQRIGDGGGSRTHADAGRRAGITRARKPAWMTINGQGKQ